jgi:hypothetical protein
MSGRRSAASAGELSGDLSRLSMGLGCGNTEHIVQPERCRTRLPVDRLFSRSNINSNISGAWRDGGVFGRRSSLRCPAMSPA